MPGRNYINGSSYRYGFNGKENDPEVTSTGKGTQDYGFRIYNPSLGRFLSVDPLAPDYPELTPYQFASNTPIQAIDLDGLEATKKTVLTNTGKTKIFITIDLQVINKSKLGASPVIGEAFMIKKQIEESFSGYDAETNTEYIFEVNLVLGEMDEKGNYINPVVDPKKHFKVIVVDKVEGGSKNTIGRLMGEFGNTQKNSVQVKATLAPQNVKKTGAHEVGHGLGLRHGKNAKSAPDPLGPKSLEQNNLMLQSAESPNGVDVNNSQRKQVSDEIDKDLNGKCPIYMEPKEILQID